MCCCRGITFLAWLIISAALLISPCHQSNHSFPGLPIPENEVVDRPDDELQYCKHPHNSTRYLKPHETIRTKDCELGKCQDGIMVYSRLPPCPGVCSNVQITSNGECCSTCLEGCFDEEQKRYYPPGGRWAIGCQKCECVNQRPLCQKSACRPCPSNTWPTQVVEGECCPRCACHCPKGQRIAKDCDCVLPFNNTSPKGQEFSPNMFSNSVPASGHSSVKPTKGINFRTIALILAGTFLAVCLAGFAIYILKCHQVHASNNNEGKFAIITQPTNRMELAETRTLLPVSCPSPVVHSFQLNRKPRAPSDVSGQQQCPPSPSTGDDHQMSQL